MQVIELELSQVRGITHAQLHCCPELNLIVGQNASGKTTILESLNIAASGRSFRAARLNEVIQRGETYFRSVIKLRDRKGNQHTLGVERQSDRLLARVDGKALNRLSDLVRFLPVHLLLPDSLVLNEGPRFRRQFLDQGVFHVEHGYLEVWQDYHRVLRQRNSSLRKRLGVKLVQAWDSQLADNASRLHKLRDGYIREFLPFFQEIAASLLEIAPDIRYQPGWQSNLSLAAQLKESIDQDLERGFTQLGCHRADIRVMHSGINAQSYYSRGQQKLLICALRLAQIAVMKEAGIDPGIMLVDDLPAELDAGRRNRLMRALAQAEVQAFVTTTERNLLDTSYWQEVKQFHVEHGQVHEMVY